MTIYAKIGSIKSRGSSDSRRVPTLPTCMVGDGGILKSPVDRGYFLVASEETVKATLLQSLFQSSPKETMKATIGIIPYSRFYSHFSMTIIKTTILSGNNFDRKWIIVKNILKKKFFGDCGSNQFKIYSVPVWFSTCVIWTKWSKL